MPFLWNRVQLLAQQTIIPLFVGLIEGVFQDEKILTNVVVILWHHQSVLSLIMFFLFFVSSQVTWVGPKLKEEKEITLYPNKNGKVSDLLEEAKNLVELSSDGSGKLRYVLESTFYEVN